MSPISKPVRQFAAVSMLVVAGLAVYTFAIGPAWEHVAGARERIEDGRILLGRLIAAAERSPRAAELQRVVDAVPLSRLVLKGDTEAIQLAGLQTLVGEAAAMQGLRVASARPLPASERDGIRLIGLRFDVRGDLQSLQALLHRIEAIEPSLMVEGVQIRTSGGADNTAAVRGVLLDSSISVYGAQPPRKG